MTYRCVPKDIDAFQLGVGVKFPLWFTHMIEEGKALVIHHP